MSNSVAQTQADTTDTAAKQSWKSSIDPKGAFVRKESQFRNWITGELIVILTRNQWPVKMRGCPGPTLRNSLIGYLTQTHP